MIVIDVGGFVVQLLSVLAGMYEGSCPFMIIVLGCWHCDTSRNSDFEVTVIHWWSLLYYYVGCVSRGGIYFGDDIICVCIRVGNDMSSWFALSLSITNHS